MRGHCLSSFPHPSHTAHPSSSRAMSIATWYHTQYHMWNRARRHQAAPFLARTGSDTSAAAIAMAQQNTTPQAADANSAGKDKKSSEPLFGPSIGSVTNGPAWTLSTEKKVVTDELTPDIVSTWIEKSKEPSQPTTTLQALVNLKRPTLRLSPLAHDDANPDSAEQHHHGLEFEYDCDAPKCGIYVHVFLPKTHPDAPPTSSHYPLSKLLVFETVVEGGFGNHLKLEEGAMLELGRFEHIHDRSPPPPESSSQDLPAVGEASSSGDFLASPSTEANGRNHARRRFTNFHFRKRTHNRSISGPALAVVDAEPAAAHEAAAGKKDGAKEEPEEGVKVTIRLAALDEQGTELASPNEQITYLHIVRLGPKVTSEGDEGAEPEEDTRPWVVKVVKREATIGPHTFHLHEIFGLTSSSHNAAPAATPLAMVPSTHTYPPEEGREVPPMAVQADDDDPQSECLLCLSSPREVVLLPCRHLVACKECALNMVEFGAGGNITQAPEPPVVGAVAEDGTPVTPAPAGAATPAPPSTQRRKRKAKGWFCPVCRQPYTSMLRLTTVPPPVSEHKDGEGSGTEDEMPSVPEQAHTHALPNNNGNHVALPPTEGRSTGLLGSTLRPGFLRGLSLGRSPPADVENQNTTVQVRT